MHTTIAFAALAVLTTLWSSSAPAQDTAEIAGLTGPAAPQGLSVEELGALALGREYAENELLATRALRARLLVLEPGGVVPVHSHANRPAVTYILEGEPVQYRSDQPEPSRHAVGEVTFDGDGIAQWWANEGDVRVVFYVVDFVDMGTKPDH